MASASPSTRIVRVGNVEIDTQSGELRSNGGKTRLADQPFQILLLLIKRREEVITREELKQELWAEDTFVDFDRGLNSAMKKLRDALGDSADQPTYIETLPRRGYRLIAPVQEPSPAETAAQPVTSARKNRARWMWAAAAIGVIALLVIVAMRFIPSVASRNIRSIAVLPLANLSGDPAQEYFADGMTEALITDLAQLQEVRVISRTSVMPYKQSKKNLPEIARELNVEGVVEGGVVHAGGRVRVTAQLIRAETDRHLWARSYESDVSDVITLQREISSAISQAIHAELTPGARARINAPQRVNPVAYEFFLKGTTAMGRENLEGFRQAITYFEKAIAIQPDFAAAYAEISLCYCQFSWSGSIAPHASMPKAKEAALKAVVLDPGLAQAHAELGRVFYQYDWNWIASELELRRALRLNPNDLSSLGFHAALLRVTGRATEAKKEMQRVRELDPLRAKTAEGVLNAAVQFRSHGDYRSAITEGRRAVQMDPALPRSHFQLGWTLVEAGQLPGGIAELEKAVQLSTNNLRFRARLGWAYALAGEEAKARAILKELEARSRQSYVSPTSLALVHIGLNETDAAIELLEQAYQQRDFELIVFNGGTTFKPLRSQPRFRELMRKIGLPEHAADAS